jgi:hypothetical protein
VRSVFREKDAGSPDMPVISGRLRTRSRGAERGLATQPVFRQALLAPGLQGGEDLLQLGEASLALLREQERAVRDDVELALQPRRDRRLESQPLTKLGRETRGPDVVAVSDGAVEDLDGHGREATCRA